MTHLIEKQKGFRRAVTIVEIDLNINDPLVDYSGDSESYNTPKTTVAALNYADSFVTYTFSNQQLGYSTPHFVCVESVSSSPAVLKPGEDVSLSASATITLQDFISNDVFELPAPYQGNRITGSFFGKLLSRNYLQNRNVRIKRGYNPDSVDDADFQIEHYVVKTHSGLDANGKITLSLIDRLFYTTESKAKAPQITDCHLITALTSVSTSAFYNGYNLGDKGKDRAILIGDVGICNIDNELIQYTITTLTTPSVNGSMNLVRGFSNTIAVAHEERAAIQGCFTTRVSENVFGIENITDVNRRLIKDFTNIGAVYINDTKWNAEKAGGLANFNFTNIISSPTDVKKLMQETIQSSGSYMFYDIIANEIIIGSSPRFDLPVSTLTDELNILEDSMRVTPQDSLQVTRSTIRYAKIDYTQGDDNRYYANSFRKIDGIKEGDAQSGNQSEAKEIKSNWYTNTLVDIVAANSIPQLKVERFSDVPEKFSFKLDSRDVGLLPNAETMWIGSTVNIQTKQLINTNGTIKNSIAQVISIKPSSQEDTWDIVALGYKGNIPTNADLYITSDQVDFVLTDLLATTEAREYTVVINSGVKITASTRLTIAFSTGTLFAGASLKIINQGFIVPAGGSGGRGGVKDGPDPAINSTPGTSGGTGMSFQCNATIDNLSGLIAGGGGGGGGGNSDGVTVDSAGGGGGGGAGDIGGAGGQVLPPVTGSNDGTAGNFNFNGVGGAGVLGGIDGGNGGGLGQNGVTKSSAGGAAGVAILTNGNTIVLLSGDNPDQIKGAVI